MTGISSKNIPATVPRAVGPEPENPGSFFSQEKLVNQSVIRHNVARILGVLKPSDWSAFELAFGKTWQEELQRWYRALHKKYFPKIQPVSGLSDKQHFQNALVAQLSILKEKQKVTLSVHEFYEAAAGRLDFLLKKEFPFYRNETVRAWLQAIQGSYHAVALPEEKGILEKIAFLFSERKEYAALEHLVRTHRTLVIGKDDNSTLRPIIFYARYGHLEKVKELLRSADPLSKGRACIEAVGGGHLEIVWKLLSVEQGVVIQDKVQVFVEAAIYGHLELMLALLHQLGVAITLEDKNNAYRLAARAGRLEVVRELLHQFGEVISRESRVQAFVWATNSGHVEIVRELLYQTGEAIDREARVQALLEAVEWGYREVVQELLKQPLEAISLEVRVEAFIKAVDWGHLEMVQGLLTQFGGVITLNQKNTALLRATSFGYIEIVREFLNQLGGEITVENKTEIFLEAASFGRVALMQELLHHFGEAISEKSRVQGFLKTVSFGDIEAAGALLDLFGEIITIEAKVQALLDCVQGEYADKLEILLSCLRIEKSVAFVEAARLGYVEVVKVVLGQFRAAISVEDQARAFYLALHNKKEAVVSFLKRMESCEYADIQEENLRNNTFLFSDRFIHENNIEIENVFAENATDANVSVTSFRRLGS